MNNFYNITFNDINRIPDINIFGNKIDGIIQLFCKRVLISSMQREDGYINDEVAFLINFIGETQAIIYGRNEYIDLLYSTDFLMQLLLVIHFH